MAANTVGTDDARAPADDPYRAVAEHLPDAAVVLFDLDLRIQLTTGTTMPDGDWLPERCVGRSLVDLAPPEQAEALAGSYRAALAGRPQHFETPGWRGPDRFWSVDVVPLHGESGAVSGGVAFWRDISQRHRAEDELLRHRRQLLDAQQLARVGSWEWEVGSSRVSWSPEMYRIMGVEPDTVLTRDRTSELIHPDDRGTRELRLARTLRDPSPFRGQFRAVRPDGTVVWLLGYARGIRDLTGRVVRLVGSSGSPPTCTTATSRTWPPSASGSTTPPSVWNGVRPALSGSCWAAWDSRCARSWRPCDAALPHYARWCSTGAAWRPRSRSWPPPPVTVPAWTPATSPWTCTATGWTRWWRP
jgi:PAS domain S-box-containing protein